MEILNEEIDKMKLMMKYDNRMTLTENITTINEGLIDKILSGGRDLRVIKSQIGPFLNDFKKVESFKNAQNVNEVINILKFGKDNANVIKDFNNVLKKQKGLSDIMKQDLSASVRNSDSYFIKYGDDLLKDNFGSVKEKMRKSGNYSDEMIDQIIKDAKATDKATLESRISKLPKQDSLISRYKEKFKAYFNGGKGKLSTQKKNDWLKRGFLKRKKGGLGSGPIKYTISKRKLIAWAAVAGVAVWVMSKWLFDNGIEEENKTDGGGGSSDGGGLGGGTKYFDCNQFPYKKGCRSSIIGEVQKCLGIKVDNTFGNDTEKALESNKYGNEITDEVYKQIKSKCDSIVQPTTTTTTTTTTTLSPGQLYGTEPTPQEFEGGTQTARINTSEI